MDLSTIHHPITELFKQQGPVLLTEEQTNFYRDNGYLAGIPLLNATQVEALRSEIDELTDAKHPRRELFYEYNSNESADPNTVLFHALGAWRILPALHDVLWNPAFVSCAEQLLNTDVRFWHDQIFYKPARHGGVVAWHQDYSYWTRATPAGHVTCWIGLDDSTLDNGCVRYLSGSLRRRRVRRKRPV